jgi:hypothetical protein
MFRPHQEYSSLLFLFLAVSNIPLSILKEGRKEGRKRKKEREVRKTPTVGASLVIVVKN